MRTHAEPPAPVLGPDPSGCAEQLASIWRELLGVARVGLDDDFFDLGGQSILAARFTARVRARLAVSMRVTDVFHHRTLGAVAALVQDRLAAGGPEPVGRWGRRPEGVPVDLTWAQRQLWFLWQMSPGSGAYNIPVAVRIRGPLDPAALQAALHDTVERHEVLRTRYPADHGVPVAVVDPVRLRLARLRLTEPELAAWLDADAARPFDLAQGPPLRAALLRLGSDDHVLAMVLHHIAGDGWSVAVLVDEVCGAYADRRAGAVHRPPLGLQLADVAHWQGRIVAADRLDRRAALLRAAPELVTFPTNRPRPAAISGLGRSLPVTCGPELATAVRRAASATGTTVFVILLAGLQLLLARRSDCVDVVVGTSVSTRDRPELEALIGCFINTVAIRTDLSGLAEPPSAGSGDADGRAVVERVQASVLDALADADLPFDQVVGRIGGAPDPGRLPLFQVMLTLHNEPRPRPSWMGGSASMASPQVPGAKCDLAINAWEEPALIDMVLVYRTELFEEDAVLGIGADYLRTLAEIAAAVDDDTTRTGESG